MPVVCPAHKLIYFPIPKNACSSIKNVLWEVNNGTTFAPFTDNGKEIRNIHQVYVSMRFSMAALEEAAPDWRECFRFVVVRDPLKRLLSAYRNRVLFHLELSEEVIASSGLTSPDLLPKPDFKHFVRHLELYRKASRSIAHHTDPQKVFIGDSLDLYDLVCEMGSIDRLESELTRRIGREIRLPVLQKLGPEADTIEFDDATRGAIYEFYRDDYELLRDYFH